MTHDELLARLSEKAVVTETFNNRAVARALRAVVELHTADFGTPGEDIVCDYCKITYPCPTIQAIRKELK